MFVVEALTNTEDVAKRFVAVANEARKLPMKAFVRFAPIADRFVVEAFTKVEEVAKRLVVVALTKVDEVAKRFAIDALMNVVVVAKSVLEVSEVANAIARLVVPVNVLSPAKVWVVVETRPRATAEALGILK